MDVQWKYNTGSPTLTGQACMHHSLPHTDSTRHLLESFHSLPILLNTHRLLLCQKLHTELQSNIYVLYRQNKYVLFAKAIPGQGAPSKLIR